MGGSFQGGVRIAELEWLLFHRNGLLGYGLSVYVIRGISIFGRCITVYGLMD
jgi:hypothetical protein